MVPEGIGMNSSALSHLYNRLQQSGIQFDIEFGDVGNTVSRQERVRLIHLVWLSHISCDGDPLIGLLFKLAGRQKSRCCATEEEAVNITMSVQLGHSFERFYPH